MPGVSVIHPNPTLHCKNFLSKQPTIYSGGEAATSHLEAISCFYLLSTLTVHPKMSHKVKHIVDVDTINLASTLCFRQCNSPFEKFWLDA